MKKIVLALVTAAALLFATPAFATFNSFGFGHVSVVRSFGFSAPVYNSTSAYFTFTPFNLTALPPVATVYQAPVATLVAPTYAVPAPAFSVPAPTFTAPAVCDPAPVAAVAAPVATVQAAPVQVAVPVQVAAPVYTASLFGVAPSYSVGTFGVGFGVHRFTAVNVSGVTRFARVDRFGVPFVRAPVVRVAPFVRVAPAVVVRDRVFQGRFGNTVRIRTVRRR